MSEWCLLKFNIKIEQLILDTNETMVIRKINNAMDDKTPLNIDGKIFKVIKSTHTTGRGIESDPYVWEIDLVKYP